MKLPLYPLSRPSLAVGIAGLIACAAGWATEPREFFLSYLFGVLFWLGIALGCFGFLMIHHLTGGKWGHPIRRFFEAAIGTLPILALLFAPILLGLSQLYACTNGASISADNVLQHT